MNLFNKVVQFLVAFAAVSFVYVIAAIGTFFIALWDWDKAKAEIKSWTFMDDIRAF